MNNIPFKDQTQFPLTADDMQNMQDDYKRIASALGILLGGNVILSGCIVGSGTIGSGIVFVNGELLPFATSAYNPAAGAEYGVTIRENTHTRATAEGTFTVLKERYAVVSTSGWSVRWRDMRRVDYAADLTKKADKIVEPRGTYNQLTISNQYVRADNVVCMIDDLGNIHLRGNFFLKNTGESNISNNWLTLFNLSDALGLSAERIERMKPQSPFVNYEGVIFTGYKVSNGYTPIRHFFKITRTGDFQLFCEGTSVFNNTHTTRAIHINLMYNNPLPDNSAPGGGIEEQI